MRLVAALLVVVSHTFPLAGQAPFRILGVEDLGALGVSIFFVISGFLVTGSYLRDPKTYLFKRLLRIEPGLIAPLVVTVLLLGIVTTAPAAAYLPMSCRVCFSRSPSPMWSTGCCGRCAWSSASTWC